MKLLMIHLSWLNELMIFLKVIGHCWDTRCGTPVGQIIILGKDPLRGKSIDKLSKANTTDGWFERPAPLIVLHKYKES